MVKNILILIISLNFAFNQFNSVEISFEHNERMIPDNKVYILEEFNSLVKNYYQSSNFSSEYDFLDIPLKIHFIYQKINFISEYEYDRISCQMLVSNNADQYYFSKNITFPYTKGKTIYYSPSVFNSLNSFLDYYAYLFIGLELDTYDLFLGSTYYQKCLDLHLSKTDLNSSAWNEFKNNIEEIENNQYLRKVRYNFYYCIDMLNSESIDIKVLKEKVLDLYNNLILILDEFGYDKNTLKFINAFHLEIADLFQSSSINEGVKFLMNFDKANKNTYKKYLEYE